MRDVRRVPAALLLITALVAAAAAAVRSVRAPVGDAAALGPALRAAAVQEEAPALVLLVDPGCPACRQAEEDLPLNVRPHEVGVHAVLLSRDEPRAGAAFAALGPGLLPAYVFVDSRGVPRSVLRGRRPAPQLRAWLEQSLARSLEPPDPNPP